MKYVALLRGINVGGNNIIKMTALQEVVTACGFTDVLTYIQSGNVIFESKGQSIYAISKTLEDGLSKAFGSPLRVVVRSYDQMKKVLADTPSEWKNENVRKYLAFVREPIKANDVVTEITLKEGIDSVRIGEGVVYMTTKLAGLTKSGFNKLPGKKAYKDITIRNYNTTLKLLALMGKE